METVRSVFQSARSATASTTVHATRTKIPPCAIVPLASDFYRFRLDVDFFFGILLLFGIVVKFL